MPGASMSKYSDERLLRLMIDQLQYYADSGLLDQPLPVTLPDGSLVHMVHTPAATENVRAGAAVSAAHEYDADGWSVMPSHPEGGFTTALAENYRTHLEDLAANGKEWALEVRDYCIPDGVAGLFRQSKMDTLSRDAQANILGSVNEKTGMARLHGWGDTWQSKVEDIANAVPTELETTLGLRAYVPMKDFVFANAKSEYPVVVKPNQQYNVMVVEGYWSGGKEKNQEGKGEVVYCDCLTADGYNSWLRTIVEWCIDNEGVPGVLEADKGSADFGTNRP